MSSSPSSGRRSKIVTNSKDGKAGDESTSKQTIKRKRSNDFQEEDSKKKAKKPSTPTPISPPTPTVSDGELVPKQLDFSDEIIKVIIENKKYGEYVLKLKTSYNNENNAMEENARAAAMLLSQAAKLRGLGEILLSKIQTQNEPMFFKSLNTKYSIE